VAIIREYSGDRYSRGGGVLQAGYKWLNNINYDKITVHHHNLAKIAVSK
jgi:hypothetical protein